MDCVTALGPFTARALGGIALTLLAAFTTMRLASFPAMIVRASIAIAFGTARSGYAIDCAADVLRLGVTLVPVIGAIRRWASFARVRLPAIGAGSAIAFGPAWSAAAFALTAFTLRATTPLVAVIGAAVTISTRALCRTTAAGTAITVACARCGNGLMRR